MSRITQSCVFASQEPGTDSLLQQVPLAPAVPLSEPAAGVLSSGDVLGSYQITQRIGAGAMGIVYEAVDLRLGRRVAIKVMRASHMGAPPEARLLQEARTIAYLDHDRFVRVYVLDTLANGQPYMVMEYLRGKTLRGWLSQPHAPRQKISMFAQLVDGMAFAHRRGIVHRDLKPENVFVTTSGLIKILDLGLAGLVNSPCTSTLRRAQVQPLGDEISGTPAYLPPETWRGAAPSPQVDVWALGVILYEALSGGRHPFWLHGCAMEFNIQRMQSQLYMPLTQVNVELASELAAIDPIVQRALARDERLRYADAGALQQALADWLEPKRASPPNSRSGLEPPIVEGKRTLAPRRIAKDHLAAGSALLSMFLWTMDSAAPKSSSLWPRDGMAQLPGGRFTLGSSLADIEAAHHFCNQEIRDPRLCIREQLEREQPAHWVTVSPFQMDRTEVTNQKFANWLNSLLARGEIRLLHERIVVSREAPDIVLADIFPYYTPANVLLFADGVFIAPREAASLPVTQVTWEGAQRYCQAQGGRLPTEAEWEYAARSGGQQEFRFPWGNALPQCNGVVAARAEEELRDKSGQPIARIRLPCLSSQLGQGPAPVGSSPQDISAQGIYDLGGNVSEWVQDPFTPRYLDCGTCKDPVASLAAYDPAAPKRVFRGGSWSVLLAHTRAAGRSRHDPRVASRDIGFRCVKSEAPSS